MILNTPESWGWGLKEDVTRQTPHDTGLPFSGEASPALSTELRMFQLLEEEKKDAKGYVCSPTSSHFLLRCACLKARERGIAISILRMGKHGGSEGVRSLLQVAMSKD